MLPQLSHINPETVLDVGSNNGQFYQEAKETWPNAEFFLIEASAACYPFLAATGQPFAIATLSDVEKFVDFYQMKDCPTATGNSYYREMTDWFADDKVEVVQKAAVPLSKVKLRHPSYDLIKIDTQGSELDIIRGGIELVKKAKWVLMEVAVEPYNQNAPLWDEVIAFMASIGFSDHKSVGDIIHPIGRHLIQRDVLFSKQTHGSRHPIVGKHY